MKRILVLTRGDYLMRLVVQPLFDDPGLEVAVAVINGDGRGRTGLRRLAPLWRASEPHYFAYELSQFLAFRLGALLARRATLDVRSLALKRGAPVLVAPLCNSPDVLDFARDFAPDLLVSAKCPQRIREPLLDIAPLGAINVHASLLPAYAGRAAPFWAMAAGETRGGVTVHRMTARFDDGPILVQKDLPIAPRSSVFDVLGRASRLGAEALAEALPLVRDGVVGTPQDDAGRSYHSHPTREAYRRFRRQGHRLIGARQVLRAMREAV